jgi:HSP20 family protein
MRNNSRINSIFFSTESHCTQKNCWSPQADVYHSLGGWVVKFDLAGVRPEDIAVSFDGSRLSVSGIRRDLFVEEGYNSYSMEISYSRFERTIRLSEGIKPARVITDYRDGMLLVRVTD